MTEYHRIQVYLRTVGVQCSDLQVTLMSLGTDWKSVGIIEIPAVELLSLLNVWY